MKTVQWVAAVTIIVAAGCATSLMPWGITKTRDKLLELEVGMTKAEVVQLLGRPFNYEVYSDPDGRMQEFLFYITQYRDGGQIQDSDQTPVCLVDHRVVGWGRNFYDRTHKYEIKIR